MKEKITELKQQIKTKQTKPVLSDPNVKRDLEEFYQKSVIIIIDKASNNSANFLTSTYSQTHNSKE